MLLKACDDILIIALIKRALDSPHEAPDICCPIKMRHDILNSCATSLDFRFKRILYTRTSSQTVGAVHNYDVDMVSFDFSTGHFCQMIVK